MTSVLLSLSLFCAGTDATPTGSLVRFPTSPVTVLVDSKPKSEPDRVPLGVFYPIEVDDPSVRVDSSNESVVSVGKFPPSVVVPGGLVYGVKNSDADFHTFSAKSSVWLLRPKASGTVTVKVWKWNGTEIVLADSRTVEVVKVPVGPDNPSGPIDPPKPGPGPSNVDAALLAKFREAVALDGDKTSSSALAGVYESAGGLLIGTGDPAALPATVGKLREQLFTDSEAARVPRLPALTKVREVIRAEVGSFADDTRLAPIREQIGKKFLTVAASLKEAVK